MRNVLMALGPFRFEMARLAHDSLARRLELRWPAQERIGRPLALQYVGPGEERVTISGTLYPEVTGGANRLDDMRKTAQRGQALMLVSGLGRVFGRFAILSVETTGTFLDRAGEPRKIEFSLEIAAYGDDGRSGGFR